MTQRELVVDLFAGGGGTSEGIRWALGRDPDVAVNHDPIALAVHAANHPATRHYCESVFRVSPIEASGGRPVGLLWLSPDCTHHSKAKGGKPRDKRIRGLAWVACRWAKEVAPRIIVLENVEEFVGWGPLLPNGLPCRRRAGKTFRAFVRKLARYGYEVEHRLLVAADYGAPTTRRRLFLIARRDGEDILWPEPTHGTGRAAPWRTAAEIIDWSLPCPSIFERRRPLAEATMRRIALGVQRYVLAAARPFVIPVTHPRDSRVHSIDEPLRTITAAHRGELALVVPTLIQTGHGERPGQEPRVPGLEKPLGTVVAGGAKHALVAAFLTKHFGGVVGHGIERPIGAVTSRDHHSLSIAFLTKFYKTVPTVTAGGQHLGEVRAFLTKHFADEGAQRQLPGAVSDRMRLGLVSIAGETFAISDIGMRMLTPRELFRAQGFGDEYVIDIARPLDGKPLTKEQQTALAGNSVPPALAAAIVRANFGERARREALHA